MNKNVFSNIFKNVVLQQNMCWLKGWVVRLLNTTGSTEEGLTPSAPPLLPYVTIATTFFNDRGLS